MIACILLASFILQFSVTFGQECGNDLICYKKPDNYPQQMIDEYLAKHKPLPYMPDNEDEELEKLLYEVDDDDMNCSTQIRLRKPFMIKYKNRSYPVIQSTYFSQRIREVSCRKSGHSCFNGISLKDRYQATCETKQGDIQLYVFDEEKNEVVAMTTHYNCCCKCTIKEN